MLRTLRALLLVAGISAASAFVGAAAAAILGEGQAAPILGHIAPWSWYLSGPQHRIYVGRLGRSSDLTLGTNGLTDGSDWQGKQITLSGTDGNFEFEHYSSARKSVITGAITRGGVPVATPVAVGAADGQDVVPLVVAASTTGTHAVQTWDSGSSVVAAVEGDGGIVVGGIELVARVGADGRVEVDAVLGNGARQTLLVGKPA